MMRYLASTLPHLAPQLRALEERLYDLEKVFKNGYCDPAFRGRTSIKSTLPAMVSNAGYESLAVRNGNDAAGLFSLMRVGKYAGAECSKHRENLLAYCKLDTLAMVRLHKTLADIRAGVR